MSVFGASVWIGGVLVDSMWEGSVLDAADPIVDLFARLNGTGVAVDPLNSAKVFADTAGTTPATLNGTVARLDSTAGVAASFTNETAGQQPLLRADGLEFDGVDDKLIYPDDPALRFGLEGFTLAFAFRADSNRKAGILGKVGLSLGPELAQEFTAFSRIAGSGSVINNGNGTFTSTDNAHARASIPLSFLTDGAVYCIEIEVLSTTHTQISSDWSDRESQNIAGVIGTYIYTSSREVYDNTFRFIDVQAQSTGSTTFRLVSFRQVVSSAGWGVRQNAADLLLSTIPAGSAPGEIVVAPAIIQVGEWVRGLISLDRGTNTATARIQGINKSPVTIPAGDISSIADLSLGFVSGGGSRFDGTIGRLLAIDKLLNPTDTAIVEQWLQNLI